MTEDIILCADPLKDNIEFKSQIEKAVINVLSGGNFILGPHVQTLEDSLAKYIDTRYSIGVNSGTDALVLALKALGIGLGDEVITVSHTALATVAAVLMVGATPVLVDIEPDFYTIDPKMVEYAITKKTKAIIAVHIYGQSCDMDALLNIKNKYGIPVIEDCAQAAGASYYGKKLGSIGDIGCFSFYPTKNLGALGDGGALTTNSEYLFERIKRLRQYGWDKDRIAKEPGINSRLDELQAAILSIKLPFLDMHNKNRKLAARRYSESLDAEEFSLPKIRENTEHVFHLYVVSTMHRENYLDKFQKKNILLGIHYKTPIHQQPGYSSRCVIPKSGLKITESLSREIISLPMYQSIKSEDVDKVISVAASGKEI